jgi:hypothetical protein
MSATPTPNSGGQKIPSELPIHFLKTGGFRVVHADGAWLSANAFGNVYLTFYTEHTPIPRNVVVKLNEQGSATDEDLSKRDTLDGLTRDVEVEIALSFPAAVQLFNVLNQNLRTMQSAIQGEVPEATKTEAGK